MQVMASGEAPTILEWLSSGGAASRSFRHWHEKGSTTARAEDRQLLFDVQKELEKSQKALSRVVDEVRAASNLEYSYTWYRLFKQSQQDTVIEVLEEDPAGSTVIRCFL